MENTVLIKKVHEMWYEKLNTREQSERVMCQVSIIRSAYGVKEWEITPTTKSYIRNREMTNEQIESRFMEYVGFWEWAVKKDSDKVKSFENKVFYFIDGVKFFDVTLAAKLENNFRNMLQVA